jgi:hypothetical protein
MKGIIILVIIALIIGAGYFLLGGSSFGMSTESPIGSFDKLDKYLIGTSNLNKQAQAKEEEVKELNAKVKIYVYADEMMQEKSGWSQHVQLMTDNKEKLVAIRGTFTTKGGSLKAEYFLKAYWKELTGAEPTFQQVSSGQGIFKESGELAQFTKENVSGLWAKKEPMETVFITYKAK